ncbi:MAG: RimK-like ATPgrasp N-terminal domain-containing protein [Nitrososphaerota archaeon]|nr:RimK-like ATPgrasp N-terminal domain-containing protein [Candidatus Bathyarchaeota archaeon]MDW8023014.1 RimK-like ATPgrasp N-terminal domain-containing protein [Nitrososphaerota archaeon]
MKPLEFLKSSVRDTILNVNNDYRYMKTGYYVSLHAEILGNRVIPSTENIVDAYRLPILLVRASKAGIPTLPYLVTDSVKQIMSEFKFPVIVFPVNPFSFNTFKIAHNRSALYRAVKSLGMNYRYAVCVQPLLGEMAAYKSFFGKCTVDSQSVNAISMNVYKIFNVPVNKLHIQHVNGEAYLCGLQPLDMEEILPSDLEMISLEISKFSEKGWFD